MNNQNGSIAILTAILLTTFLGFVVLSVDTGYLVASKNELQNAADAGALAGARELYSEDGSGINTNCNLIAYNTAMKNYVANDEIEILGNGTNNTEDIQRGHWSFATGEFTQSDNTTVELWDEDGTIIPKDVLDADLTFVNAVEVTVRRETNPITLFFARLFDQSEAKMSATAVAYIGFVGTFYSGDFDAPVALCIEMLALDPDNPEVFTCGNAVWFEKDETAMWTNFLQVEEKGDACTSGNTPTVMAALNGNLGALYTGLDMGVINGNSSVHPDLKAIWETNSNVDGEPTARKIVEVALPVINCFDEDTEQVENTCAQLVGGVTVELLWMTDNTSLNGNNNAYDEMPTKLYDLNGNVIFTSSEPSGEDRWDDFIRDEDIALVEPDAPFLDLATNQMYFRASCETSMDPAGAPGGENFGILSKTPVLVN